MIGEACNGICEGKLTAAVFFWWMTILELIPQALLISAWKRMKCKRVVVFIIPDAQPTTFKSQFGGIPSIIFLCLCLCNAVSYQKHSLN